MLCREKVLQGEAQVSLTKGSEVMFNRSILVLLALLTLPACGAELQAQIVTQSFLAGGAMAALDLDEAIQAQLPGAHQLAMAKVGQECPAPCPDWEARYDRQMEKLTQARAANRAFVAGLREGQKLTDQWVAGELPSTWLEKCGAIAGSVAPLPDALKAAGLAVPVWVGTYAGPATQVVCDQAARWAGKGERGE